METLFHNSFNRLKLKQQLLILFIPYFPIKTFLLDLKLLNTIRFNFLFFYIDSNIKMLSLPKKKKKKCM